jgi:hypothetical protein
MTGTVRDAAGGPLLGASVIALPEGGGVATRTVTDREGNYRLALAEGTYRIDFSLLGFAGTRRNHVRRGLSGIGHLDAILAIRPICECISGDPSARQIPGRVVDTAGHPLPHARLEIIGPKLGEVAYADGEGRFQVKLPVSGVWSLVASDSGFRSLTQHISAATAAPVILSLAFSGTDAVPDTERFNTDCRCDRYLNVR